MAAHIGSVNSLTMSSQVRVAGGGSARMIAPKDPGDSYACFAGSAFFSIRNGAYLANNALPGSCDTRTDTDNFVFLAVSSDESATIDVDFASLKVSMIGNYNSQKAPLYSNIKYERECFTQPAMEDACEVGTNNNYLFLTNVSTSVLSTFTAGRFIIELWGYDTGAKLPSATYPP